MSALSRRQFVKAFGATLGVVAGCSSPVSRLQQGTRTHRIGYLSAGAAGTTNPHLFEAFRDGLRELGYVEGRNLVIEARFAATEQARLPELAAELVELPVDVLVAGGGPFPPLAARAATDTIPIVAVFVADPVRAGHVASLARPGGNITGLAQFVGSLGAKRLELLKETLPDLLRVAWPWDNNNALTGEASTPNQLPDWRDLVEAAGRLGMQLQRIDVRYPGELDTAFAAASQGQAEALFLNGGPLFVFNIERVVALAALQHLPAMYWTAEFVWAGGLMSYAPNQPALLRRAAYYVDRILKGTSPADLPVEQPTVFDLTVNLQTARALGLTIPERVLLQATEVIE